MTDFLNDLELNSKKEFIAFLSELILPERVEKLKQVASNRTRHLTLVLENIFQAQNTSAVLRSCECFGIQEVHIIENTNEFNLHPDIVMGASKWLNMHQYNQMDFNTKTCIHKLKSEGYRIVATAPSLDGHTIFDLPLEQKTALMFGTELTGLSDEAMQMADDFMSIPMQGFTESLNISVSAAISLFHLTHRLHSSEIPWQLTDNENHDLLITWMLEGMRRPDLLIEKFLKEKGLVS